MMWITIAEIGKALEEKRLWLLSKGDPPHRRMAIADNEAEARAQFDVVDDTWECRRAIATDDGFR